MAEIILSEHGRKQTPKIEDSRRKWLCWQAGSPTKTEKDAALRALPAGAAKNRSCWKFFDHSKYGV
jgi:hypothetical protein